MTPAEVLQRQNKTTSTSRGGGSVAAQRAAPILTNPFRPPWRSSQQLQPQLQPSVNSSTVQIAAAASTAGRSGSRLLAALEQVDDVLAPAPHHLRASYPAPSQHSQRVGQQTEPSLRLSQDFLSQNPFMRSLRPINTRVPVVTQAPPPAAAPQPRAAPAPAAGSNRPPLLDVRGATTLTFESDWSDDEGEWEEWPPVGGPTLGSGSLSPPQMISPPEYMSRGLPRMVLHPPIGTDTVPPQSFRSSSLPGSMGAEAMVLPLGMPRSSSGAVTPAAARVPEAYQRQLHANDTVHDQQDGAPLAASLAAARRAAPEDDLVSPMRRDQQADLQAHRSARRMTRHADSPEVSTLPSTQSARSGWAQQRRRAARDQGVDVSSELAASAEMPISAVSPNSLSPVHPHPSLLTAASDSESLEIVPDETWGDEDSDGEHRLERSALLSLMSPIAANPGALNSRRNANNVTNAQTTGLQVGPQPDDLPAGQQQQGTAVAASGGSNAQGSARAGSIDALRMHPLWSLNGPASNTALEASESPLWDRSPSQLILDDSSDEEPQQRPFMALAAPRCLITNWQPPTTNTVAPGPQVPPASRATATRRIGAAGSPILLLSSSEDEADNHCATAHTQSTVAAIQAAAGAALNRRYGNVNAPFRPVTRSQVANAQRAAAGGGAAASGSAGGARYVSGIRRTNK